MDSGGVAYHYKHDASVRKAGGNMSAGDMDGMTFIEKMAQLTREPVPDTYFVVENDRMVRLVGLLIFAQGQRRLRSAQVNGRLWQRSLGALLNARSGFWLVIVAYVVILATIWRR